MRKRSSLEGWVQVFDRFTATNGAEKGKRVFVTADKKPMYDFLEVNHEGDYHLTTLVREIMNLSSDPFPLHSQAIDPKEPNKRQLSLDGGYIEYFLHNGDVLVNKLEHGNSYRSLRTNPVGSGLHPGRLVNVSGSQIRLLLWLQISRREVLIAPL